MAANKWEITLTPDAFIPDSTNHPDRGIVQNRPYLAFDADTQQTCYSQAFRLPDAYAGGTVTCGIAYCMASATANTVEFEVAVEAITEADATDMDAASSFDTANSYTETVPGTAGYLSVLTGTLTNKDSMAAGDYVRISLARDADDGTNDTATGDARVFWVSFYEA